MSNVRHFMDLDLLEPETIKAIIKHAHELKAQKFEPPQLTKGHSLAMLFDKRSTRTRISFEVGMKQLGGHTVVLNMDDIQLAGAESLEDTANVLSRFVDAIMIRMSNHDMLSEFASHCSVPVINGMTDKSHPCQIMADILTIEEKLGSAQGKKIVWLGDYNNVTKTFEQAAPIFDFELVISTPKDLAPSATGDHVSYQEDALKAAKGADVIVTDTWVSMGQEGKSIDKFMPYQVNTDLMAQANDNAIFMHCMPIHENEEVVPEVLKTPACVIYDEAENRLHAQKAILAWCLENSGVTIK
jgi:ornithine carbamoyltransferase